MDKKILFVVNHSDFFHSHRLPFALAAQEKGFDVHVATSPTGLEKKIRSYGFKWHHLKNMVPGGKNPIKDVKLLYELYNLYSLVKPNIIHHVTIKPVMYGGIAARLAKIEGVINALSGLGYLFRSDALLAKLLRVPIYFPLKYALNHPNSILLLQNSDDQNLFVKRDIIERENIVIIRGSGVDIKKFVPFQENTNPPIILLASRMLWDKGIGEFVEAADIVNKTKKNARFVLVGKPDENNPKSIKIEKLKSWNEEGIIEWWGFRDDMPEVIQKSSMVVLPSYYEGVPKILIEAAACAKPIVTTDVPGCREIVINGINGYLVKPKNSNDLAKKIISLLTDEQKRISMGKESRKLAVQYFSLELRKKKTLDLYEHIMNNS